MDSTKVMKDLEAKTFTIERTLDAPKDKVWQAYANKGLFARWWGPEGWETTLKEFDFTPGGRALYGMKCVDENQGEFFGQTSWGLMVYETIEAPHRFTYRDYFADADGTVNKEMPALAMSIELTETDGKTTITSQCQGESAEDIEKLLAMGMVEGFSSSVNKLEKLLTETIQ